MPEEHKEQPAAEEGHSSGHGGGHGGGGSHEEAHEGAPEWLISFADNTALMMGFFVILLAMNMGPKSQPVQGGEVDESNAYEGRTAQQMDMIISIREGFNNPVNIFSDRPEEQPLIRRLLERKGGQGKSQGVKGKYERNQTLRPTDYDRVAASVPFDDKSTALTAEARAIIAEAAQRMKQQRWVVEVRGHVSPFESMRNTQRAMQLSYERAFAAAQAMVDSGMQWEALRVVACGDSDRVVPRTFDREEDRTNQRVEIVVTNRVVSADPYTMPGKAGDASGEPVSAPGTQAAEPHGDH